MQPTCTHCGVPMVPGLGCCLAARTAAAKARTHAPGVVRLPASTHPSHRPNHGRWRTMQTGAISHAFTGVPLAGGGRPAGYSRG